MNYIKIFVLFLGISFAADCFGMEAKKVITQKRMSLKEIYLNQMWAHIININLVEKSNETLHSKEEKIKEQLDAIADILSFTSVSFFDTSEIYCKKDKLNLYPHELNLPLAAISFAHLGLLKQCSRHLPFINSENNPENIFLLNLCANATVGEMMGELMLIDETKVTQQDNSLNKIARTRGPIIHFLSPYAK